MTWYKCFVEGENFSGELIGENRLIGFFTTRFVEATSIDDVEKTVLSNLRKESVFQFSAGIKLSSGAMVYINEIIEIDAEDVPQTQPGLSFYVMGT
jgi:hypothetical protein